MAFKFPDKDPDEKLDYTVDWSRFIVGNQTIKAIGVSSATTWKIQKLDGSYVEIGADQSFQNDVVLTNVADTRTADINGAVSSSTSLALDNNSGTITVGQRVTGTGITGNVYVTAVASQTSITVSTAVTIANDTQLTFTTHGVTITSESITTASHTCTVVLTKGIANTTYRLLCQVELENANGLITSREINLRVRERS